MVPILATCLQGHELRFDALNFRVRTFLFVALFVLFTVAIRDFFYIYTNFCHDNFGDGKATLPVVHEGLGQFAYDAEKIKGIFFTGAFIPADASARGVLVERALVLKGVMLGLGNASSALIGLSGRSDDRIFKVGEVVFDKGIIYEIARDRVLMKNEGGISALYWTPGGRIKNPSGVDAGYASVPAGLVGQLAPVGPYAAEASSKQDGVSNPLAQAYSESHKADARSVVPTFSKSSSPSGLEHIAVKSNGPISPSKIHDVFSRKLDSQSNEGISMKR